jgi:membrane associated rhomboid family serine protease
MGAAPFAFPEFRGATRQLVLANLVAFFVLLVLGLAAGQAAGYLTLWLSFIPRAFLHGALWQPLTYSFIHTSITGTLFELLSLWFLVSFLETYRGSNWVLSLYAVSVIGTALTAAVIYVIAAQMNSPFADAPIMGCFGGIFGLLVAIGVLYGEVEFMMFFIINIKAKYLAIIYALIAFAMLFSSSRLYAFSELGGAAAGLLFIQFAPKRGFGFAAGEWVYGLRNSYYRWKRRRAGRKFEVYMKKQGRNIRLDSRGRPIHDDEPNDRSHWN